MTSCRAIRPRYPVFEQDRQPTAFHSDFGGAALLSYQRAASSSSSTGGYSSLHHSHSRRASPQSTEEPTRNGSMPISVNRVTALGASLVCSVDSTRWPVSAASTAS